MNKRLYRVIFNKKRGMQMVVADIAKTPIGSEQTSSAREQASLKSLFVKLKPITFFMSISLGFVSISSPVYGSHIVPDGQANKKQQPLVTSAANGTTQVNIQTPNKKGVSHNKYQQFDVSKQGVILNNSSKISKTQIGGYVQGNELLNSTGSAKIILNEVNSRNPSQLNGVVEVAGQKAQVVIANPSGITCNGCGFINASRGTLTTGKPIIENGDLTGYQVEQGHIAVTGKGLDSSTQSYTDLIARTVSINSSVWANELTVVTGRNKVSRDTQKITPLDEQAGDKPEVSIDVSALGGMYAGKINLVGTEKGVGVHNAGELGASAGSITVTADGKIVNKGALQAQQDIRLSSQNDISNSKQIYSKKAIQLKSKKSIVNEGSLVAKNDIILNASDINSTKNSTLAAGIDEQGKLTQKSNITADANNISLNGKNLAGQDINVNAQKNINLSNSQNIAQSVTLTAENIDINTATIHSEKDIKLQANNAIDSRHLQAKTNANYLANAKIIDNQQSILVAKEGIAFNANSINNAQSKLNAGSKINFNAENLIDNHNTTLLANGAINLQSQHIVNNESLLVSNNDINIMSSHIDAQKAKFKAKGNIKLNASDYIDATNGLMVSEQQSTIEANVVKLNEATLSAKDDMAVTATSQLDNNNAKWISEGNIRANAQTINNQNSLISSYKNIYFKAPHLNNLNSKLLSYGTIGLVSNKVNNQNTQINARADIHIQADDIDNQNAQIISQQSINIEGKDIDNRHLAMQSGKTLSIIAIDKLNNADATLISGNKLKLESQLIDNQRSKIKSQNNLTMQGKVIDNQHSTMIAAGDVDFSADEQLDNQQADIRTQSKIIMASKQINNQNNLLVGGNEVTLNADELNSQSSILKAGDSIHIKTKKLNSTSAKWVSQNAITVNSDEINNQDALWLADKHISIHANNLDNRNAALQAKQSMQMDIMANLANQQATLISGQDGLIIHADSLNNEDSELSSKGGLAITANDVNNHQAQLVTESDLTIEANNINNQSVDIQAKGNVNIDGQTIDNQQATLLSMGNIRLHAKNNLANNRAKLTAMQQIQLQSHGAIDNQNSTEVANNGILIEADSINNSQSKLETASLLKINTNAISNQRAKFNAGSIELKTQSLENQEADIIAKTLLHIQADKITNSQARLLANDITINANQLSGDGELLAENNIELNLTHAFDNKNSLLANKGILINASHITNDGKISSGQAITLKSDEIKNTERGIIESEEINTNSRLLENKGLIDGGDVNLNVSQRFDNLEGARLYGDWIYIKANEVNNRATSLTSTIAPTIAAREALLFDVNTLNNSNHALILSLGDMYIEGQTLNNHSARIESADDMALKVNQINNINDHIETEEVLVDSQHIIEYSPSGDERRFKPDEVSIRTSPKKRHRYPVLHSNNGAFSSTYKYYKYDYTRNTYETKIKSTAPAEIISGKDLLIQSDHLENDNSKIIAGNALDIMTGTLNNHSLKGQRTVSDVGNQIYHYRNKEHNSKGQAVYTKKAKWGDYKDQSVTTIDLEHAKIQSNSHVDKTNVNLQQREENAVSVGQILNPIVTEVKTEKQLDNSLEDIIISTEHPLDDLPSSNPIIDPNPDGAIIDEDQNTDSIAFVEPNLTLPQNSLSIINKDPKSNYLVETDSRFINRKKWLSSDYMLDQLRADPNHIQKRLGDGYYEQQLIREQITALTGHRYIGDYTSDLEQYKALMNAGVAFAKQYGLSIGASLSAEQMKALTSDIVWLESKTVMVDGKPVSVLVPQVYLVNRPQLTTDGALLSGKSVTVIAKHDIESSGTVLGKKRVALLGDNINNQGLINAEGIVIQAKDSINSSGTLSADKLAYLQANNDINLNSTTSTTETHYGASKSKNTVIDQISSINVKDGDIVLKAGHDINLGAALVVNGGEDGVTNMIAGHDINLSTLTTESYQDAIWSKNHTRKVDIENVVGSELLTNGDLNLIAGHDILAKSAELSSDKRINLLAEHDIDIGSEQERLQLTEHHKTKTKGLLNKGSITEDIEVDNITQKGSGIYGDSVTIDAGNNLTVTGSEVIGTHNVSLGAGKDITIDAAEESYYHMQKTVTKKSGLMGSGGIGFTVGKEKENLKQTDTEQAFVGSVVGSTNGNVTLQAGKDLNIKGSDVIAQRDIRMQGENVNIEALDAKTTYKEEYSYEKSGLTVALTGTAADMYEAAKAVERAKKKGNDKLLALQSIKSALTAIEALEDSQLKNQQGQSQASIGVSAMVGTQRTEREVNQEQHSVISSGVSAGRNIDIIATGDANKQGGDITLKGSEVKAGNDINLTANRDLNVIGAVNTQHSDSDEKSYGGGVGIQLQFGGDESGLRFKGNANFSRERENANGSAWTESVIDANNKLTIKTGNDVNIIGGQVKGESVKMDVGHNLNIQSLQDTDDYDYEKISASVSGSGGFGGFSANGSLSSTNIDSKWASVTDQSGIFAGSGGYDITVGNHTDLKGAVIASEAKDTSKNKLDTGTISFSDIENKA
ncbi:two-partner secretion domain-containing protein, partial [Gilliamella sp. Pra-s54]